MRAKRDVQKRHPKSDIKKFLVKKKKNNKPTSSDFG